jgi:uncharacterized protein YndB with AHSA1/START domain
MMTTLPEFVETARRFSVGAEQVFDAWLEAERVTTWLFPDPADEVVRAAIDARQGGAFTFVVRRGGHEIEYRGDYLEIDRPHLLVFTWSSADESGQDRVVVEIVSGDDGCDLRLTHVLRHEAAGSAIATEAAWSGRLETLAATLRRHLAITP